MAGPLLESRDGRLLLAAQAISFGAHGIASVALPWLVLDEHGSPAAAGLVFTFTTSSSRSPQASSATASRAGA